MGPRPSPLWWELLRVRELMVNAAVLAAMAAAAVSMLVGAGHLARVCSPRWRVRWWLHRRATRAFVAAVTGGELDVAEAAARRVLGGNDPSRRRGPPRVRRWVERG